MAFTRKEILEKLRNNIKQGIPIIGTGAGTGISAKFEEAGGTDLIIVYNSGRFRMAGRGSTAGLFAYGNANQIVVDMAWEVLPVVKHTPVLAGVNGSDPTIVDMKKFLMKLNDLGYSGVQNFPTMGLVEGLLRQTIEDTGMGYSTEVEMIRIAHELDMFTSPYVFNTKEAVDMVKAGADMIVAHMGCTIGGTIGVNTSTAVTLDDSVKKIQEIRDVAVAENPDIIVICHGGPLAEPEDAEYVLKRTKGVHGFYGASSAERLPVEKAITGHIKTFKTIKF